MSNDRLAKALFQLAVCGGSLSVPQDLVLRDKTSKTSEQTKTVDKAPTSAPSEGSYTGTSVSAIHIMLSDHVQSCAKVFCHIGKRNKRSTLLNRANINGNTSFEAKEEFELF